MLLWWLGLATSFASADDAPSSPEVVVKETVIHAHIEAGGYGAPVWGLTPTHGGLVNVSGGRGGAIFDHRFVIGGHGNTSTAVDGGRLSYGGPFIEWMPLWDRRVHPDFDLAWGSGRWRQGNGARLPVQVVQAAVRADAALTPWCHLAAGPLVRAVMVHQDDQYGSAQVTVGGDLQLRFGAF